MRLTYLSNLRLPTEKAYGIQIVKMCQAFSFAGVKVTLLHPYRRNKIRDNLYDYYAIPKSFESRRICSPDFYLPGFFDRIAVAIKELVSAVALTIFALKLPSDIIFSRDELPIFFLSFTNRRLVFEAHRFSKNRSWFYKILRAKNIPVIAISNGVKEDLVTAGVMPDAISVARDGVDLSMFENLPDKVSARRIVGLPEDWPVVMYTGHLFSWKGADILAEAAYRVPESLFVFVGGTDADIKKFSEKFGNVPNIKIVGRRPHTEIPTWLTSADVLVIPNSALEAISSRYTSPLKLFEYMASQRIIVASDISSVREILNEGNAVLVEPDDPSSLADGIRRALNDPNSETVARRALKEAENYTWTSRAGSILTFLRTRPS